QKVAGKTTKGTGGGPKKPESKKEKPKVEEKDLKGPYDAHKVRDDLEKTYPGKVSSSTVPNLKDKNVKYGIREEKHPSGIAFDKKGFPIFDKHVKFDTKLPDRVSNIENPKKHM